MEEQQMFFILMLMVFAIFLFIPIQNSIINLDIESWTFTGHEQVALFLPIFPYLYLVAVILIPVYTLIKKG